MLFPLDICKSALVQWPIDWSSEVNKSEHKIDQLKQFNMVPGAKFQLIRTCLPKMIRASAL